MAPKEKPEKTKTKRDKDQRQSSKPASEDFPEKTYLPDNFGFLWSIDALQAIYDDKHPKRMLPISSKNGNDIAKVWFPPNVREMFTRRNGNLYRWRKWGSEIVISPRPEKKVEVASVFFQARLDNFVGVFKDCTRHDIAKEDFGWSHLAFHHNHGRISEVDLAGEKDVLAAPANGSSWMPQVLPEVYNYPIRDPSKSFAGEYGGLCGKLSLLIAMAAFSASEQHAEVVVAKCFQFGEWTKHQFETGIGRYQNRGVVVSIYLDPDVVGLTKDHIKALEEGRYGPIFATRETPRYTTLPSGTSSDYTVATPRTAPYSIALNQSGHTTTGGYTVPATGGYTVPATGGYTTSYPAAGGYPAQQMVGPDTDIYSREDDDHEQKTE